MGSGYTYTPTSDETYNINIYINNSQTFSNTIFKPMVTLDTSLTYDDYIPHKEQICSIDTKNRNLFKDIPTKTLNGVTLTNNGDGTYTLNGTTTAYSRFIIQLDEELEVGDYTMVGRTSTTGNMVFIEARDIDQGQTIFTNNKNTTLMVSSLTTTKKLKYVDITCVNANETYDNYIVTPMLLKGTYTTSNLPNFVKYTEEYSFPLYSTSDYYYKQNGNWYVYNEYAKKIFDGTETIIANYVLQGYLCEHYIKDKYADGSSGDVTPTYSNYFKNVENQKDYSTTTNIMTNSRGKAVGNSSIYFENAYTTSADTFKNWLATLYSNGTPMYLIYKLQTPTTTQITNDTLIEQLNFWSQAKSYDEGTNITITANDLSPYLKGKVFLDTASAIATTDVEV